MKQLALLCVLVVFSSCSHVTENIIDEAFPEPEGLEIGVKNNTNLTFLRTEILAANGNLVFQQIAPNSYSGFYEMSAIYSEVEITVQTENGYYSYKPTSYNQDTRVTKGRFYFEVSIITPGNTLVVTRKSF